VSEPQRASADDAELPAPIPAFSSGTGTLAALPAPKGSRFMTTPARFPAPDFSTIGPPAGERFPDVVLPDQHGRLIDLHAERGSRRALIVFHRSARW
jgi:hypothetical protein